MELAEEWRPVVGYEGAYEVSDLGRVRSLTRLLIEPSGRRRTHRGRVLKPESLSTGYLAVKLCVDKEIVRFVIHKLVASAFLGPRPDGMDTRHLNGNPHDNRLSNLRYGTRSENMQDAVRHGTHGKTRQTHCKRGHEFTPENTRRYRTGRYCRACERLRARGSRQNAA